MEYGTRIDNCGYYIINLARELCNPSVSTRNGEVTTVSPSIPFVQQSPFGLESFSFTIPDTIWSKILFGTRIYGGENASTMRCIVLKEHPSQKSDKSSPFPIKWKLYNKICLPSTLSKQKIYEVFEARKEEPNLSVIGDITTEAKIPSRTTFEKYGIFGFPSSSIDVKDISELEI